MGTSSAPQRPAEADDFFAQADRLLGDKHAHTLVERHARILIKATKLFKEGIFMRDIGRVKKILAFLSKQLELNQSEILVKSTASFLRLCAKPALPERTSEALEARALLENFLANVADFVQLDQPEITFAICEAFERYSSAVEASSQSAPHAVSMRQSATLSGPFGELHRSVLATSGIAERFIDVFRRFDKQNRDAPTQLRILRALASLTRHRELACTLCETSAVQVLVAVLGEENMGTQNFQYALDALLRLVDADTKAASILLAHTETFSTLIKLVMTAMQEGYRLQDKNVRNDLLALIAAATEAEEFRRRVITSGFLLQFARLLVAEVFSDPCDLLPSFARTSSSEDFELLCAVFAIVEAVLEDPELAEIARERLQGSRLFEAIAIVLGDPDTTLYHQKWPNVIAQELQRRTLSLLYSAASVDSNGAARASIGGALGSLLEREDPSSSILFNPALRAVQSLCRSSIQFAEQLGDAYAVRTCLEAVSMESTSAETRRLAAQALSTLVHGSPANDRRFKLLHGVDVLQASISVESLSSVDDTEAACSILYALWRITKERDVHRNRFLALDGLHLLLQCIEDAPAPVAMLSLAAMTDLIDLEPRVCPIVLGWESATSRKTAVQIFLARCTMRGLHDEGVPKDALTDVSAWRDPDVLNVLAPSELQNRAPPLQNLALNSPVAMCVRVSLVLQKLGLTTEHRGLTPEEKRKIIAMQGFPAAKEREVWGGVRDDLETENCRPVTPDREKIANALESTLTETSRVINLLHKEEAAQKEEELRREEEFFSSLSPTGHVSVNKIRLEALRERSTVHAFKKKQSMILTSFDHVRGETPSELSDASSAADGMNSPIYDSVEMNVVEEGRSESASPSPPPVFPQNSGAESDGMEFTDDSVRLEHDAVNDKAAQDAIAALQAALRDEDVRPRYAKE